MSVVCDTARAPAQCRWRIKHECCIFISVQKYQRHYYLSFGCHHVSLSPVDDNYQPIAAIHECEMVHRNRMRRNALRKSLLNIV